MFAPSAGDQSPTKRQRPGDDEVAAPPASFAEEAGAAAQGAFCPVDAAAQGALVPTEALVLPSLVTVAEFNALTTDLRKRGAAFQQELRKSRFIERFNNALVNGDTVVAVAACRTLWAAHVGVAPPFPVFAPGVINRLMTLIATRREGGETGTEVLLCAYGIVLRSLHGTAEIVRSYVDLSAFLDEARPPSVIRAAAWAISMMRSPIPEFAFQNVLFGLLRLCRAKRDYIEEKLLMGAVHTVCAEIVSKEMAGAFASALVPRIPACAEATTCLDALLAVSEAAKDDIAHSDALRQLVELLKHRDEAVLVNVATLVTTLVRNDVFRLKQLCALDFVAALELQTSKSAVVTNAILRLLTGVTHIASDCIPAIGASGHLMCLVLRAFQTAVDAEKQKNALLCMVRCSNKMSATGVRALVARGVIGTALDFLASHVMNATRVSYVVTLLVDLVCVDNAVAHFVAAAGGDAVLASIVLHNSHTGLPTKTAVVPSRIVRYALFFLAVVVKQGGAPVVAKVGSIAGLRTALVALRDHALDQSKDGVADYARVLCTQLFPWDNALVVDERKQLLHNLLVPFTVSGAVGCGVCVDTHPSQQAVLLPCFHSFHLPCVDVWISRGNDSCPVCKHPVLTTLRRMVREGDAVVP